VVATSNEGKLRELSALFSGLPLELLLPSAIGGMPEVVEDGLTFEANAVKKAEAVAAATGLAALADDSGLEVDALDGRPGVFSARYAALAGAGEGTEANNVHLLHEMADATNRQARFRCALAFVAPPARHVTFGACEGEIGRAQRGTGGFGYDPLFFLPDGRAMAELTRDEKAAISHRGRAAVEMRQWLEAFLAR
jgi:XTP/dITP diphosphohydrolase